MKNTFKLFGVMLLASATLFAACDPTEEEGTNTNTNPETGATQYTITAQANNAEWGTVTGGGLVDSGATVTLTAAPAAGYEFVNWTTPTGTANNNPLTFAATENATYTANFQAQVTDGVTFGTEHWTPAYMNAQMANNAILLAFAKTSSSSYPICQIYYGVESGSIANGTFNGHPEMALQGETSVSISFGNPYVWFFESGSWDLQGQSGNIETGDWWGKAVTLSISNLDATALTANIVVNADLCHVTEMVNDQGQLTTLDFDDVTSRTFTATFNDLQFTAASKSLASAKKAVAAIAR